MSRLNKSEAIYALDSIIELHKKKEDFVVFIPSKPNLSKDEMMAKEFELLGYYLTKHPLDNYKSKLESVDKIGELTEYPTNKQITVCGIIIENKVIQTKAGKAMAFLTLEDLTGRVEVIVFPGLFEKSKSNIIKNNLVEINGKVEIEETEAENEEDLPVKSSKILCSSVRPLQEIARIKEIILRLNSKEDLKEILKLIEYESGNVPIFIEYDNFLLETSFRISQNIDILNRLKELCLIKEVIE